MAFQPPRSLLTQDTSEPLPLYSSRRCSHTDLETSSIHSSAPSYVSAAPSYHSAAPPSHRRVADNNAGQRPSAAGTPSTEADGPGLRPAPQYAPGFGTTVSSSSGPSASSASASPDSLTSASVRSLYNIAEWVPATEGLQSRHYHNVAQRRVSEAFSENNTVTARWTFPLLFSAVPETEAGTIEGSGIDWSRRHTSPNLSDDFAGNPCGTTTTPCFLSSSSSALPGGGQPAGNGRHQDELAQQEQLAQTLPLSPHEDPALVGEEAAARFRSQRLYRTYQQQVNQGQSQSQSQPSQSSQIRDDGRSRHHSQPGRPYQYSSLIPRTPSSSPPEPSPSPPQEEHRPRTASPSAVSETPSSPSNVDAVVESTTLERSSTTPALGRQTPVADFEEEAKTWDWIIAQMADWEERQRDWKRFKEDFDRRLASRSGLFWVNRYTAGGGNRPFAKLKKANTAQGNGNPTPKKWKSKVGLAT